MVEPFPINAFLRSGAFLRRPDGSTVLAIGLHRAAAPVGEVSFYAPDFYLEDTLPWWNTDHAVVYPRGLLPSVVSAQTAARKVRRWDDPIAADFREAFRTLRDWFSDESVVKAVLSAFATTTEPVDEHEHQSAITRAWALPPAFLPCGLWHDGEGFLSATPELLFQKGIDRLDTMALAATRRHPSSTAWTAKEIREHALVVSDLRRALAPFGNVQIGPISDRVVGPMVHLYAPITCGGSAVKKASLEDLVHALHPTAALGVAPRSFPWRRLRELDGAFTRNRFGAPFAARFADGTAIAVVAIRAVQWNDSGCLLASGAGVLPESDCDAEWRELALKRRATCEALGL